MKSIHKICLLLYKKEQSLKKILGIALLLGLLFFGQTSLALWPALAPVYEYEVVKSYPHDRLAYTQGLVFEEGVLFEGTGLYGGRSSLRKVTLENGQVIKKRHLPPWYFGEGITIFDDRIIQLTWQGGVGLVYDKKNFKFLEKFSYDHEGWGITHNGEHLIVSDGSNRLRFWNPQTFKEVSAVLVTEGAKRIWGLNELEYIDGLIFANIYPTNRIAVIEPLSGQVTGWLDLTDIGERGTFRNGDVLNGIAYDQNSRRIFVTGKLWSQLFEIKIIR